MRLKSNEPLRCPECGSDENIQARDLVPLYSPLTVKGRDFEYSEYDLSEPFWDGSVNDASEPGKFALYCRLCGHDWEEDLGDE